MDDYPPIKKLEYRGILQIIIILHEKEMLISHLQNTTGINNETLYKAKRQLQELKIIEEKPVEWTTYKPYRLTEKGKKIAEHLQNISEILQHQ